MRARATSARFDRAMLMLLWLAVVCVCAVAGWAVAMVWWLFAHVLIGLR